MLVSDPMLHSVIGTLFEIVAGRCTSGMRRCLYASRPRWRMLSETIASKPPIMKRPSILYSASLDATPSRSWSGSVRFVPSSEPPRVVHWSTRSHLGGDKSARESERRREVNVRELSDVALEQADEAVVDGDRRVAVAQAVPDGRARRGVHSSGGRSSAVQRTGSDRAFPRGGRWRTG